MKGWIKGNFWNNIFVISTNGVGGAVKNTESLQLSPDKKIGARKLKKITECSSPPGPYKYKTSLEEITGIII